MNGFITAVSSDSEVPVNIITAIIAAIMQIMSNCPAPAPTPSEIKTGSIRWTLAVYRGMLMSGMRPLRADGQRIYSAMVRHSATLADADVTDFLAQCGAVPI